MMDEYKLVSSLFEDLVKAAQEDCGTPEGLQSNRSALGAWNRDVLDVNMVDVVGGLAQDRKSKAHQHTLRLLLDVIMKKLLDSEAYSRTELRDMVLSRPNTGAVLRAANLIADSSSLYSPIQDHHIRLLTLIAGDDEDIIYQLDTHSYWMAPEYDAVSYSWGEDKETTFILCNGFKLEIRKSLRHTLKYLMADRPRPIRPLWIDAICLNQNDDEEKAAQVPRMGEIYEGATRTLICLGEEVQGGGRTLDHLQWLASRIEHEVDTAPWRQELKGQDIGRILNETLHQSWFSRLWVVQELILSKEIIVMYGHTSVKWSSLVSTIRALDDRFGVGAKGFDISQVTTNRHLSSLIMRCSGLDVMRSNHKRRGFSPLFHLMDFCELRECGEPVDRVWALMGLVRKRLRQQIKDLGAINYDLASRTQYCRSYLAVMKALFFADKVDFWLLLCHGQGLAKSSPLPSWCPDWNAPRLYEPCSNTYVGFGVGSNYKWPELSLSAQKAWLLARGFSVDTVRRSTATAPGLPPAPRGSQMETLGRWKWMQECFSLIVEVLATSEGAANMFGQVIASLETRSKVVEDIQLKVSRAFEAWSLDLPDIEVKMPQSCDVPAFWTVRGRSLFSTVNNRLGLGPPGMKPGDEVVVFPGSGALFILRKTDKRLPEDSIEGDDQDESGQPRDRYHLIGDASVDGLMQGEAFTADSRGPDTTFVLV